MKGLESFGKQDVLVVGDMMVDKYIMGKVDRISPEAPVPVLREQEVRRKPGGAGNVIMNIISLGARVRAVGRVGDDSEGAFFRESLRKCGADDRYVFSEGSTIVKTRVSASNQQFIRIDEEAVVPPSGMLVREISLALPELMQGVTAVIISDYAKGFVTEELSQMMIQAARRCGVPVLVDPKGKSAVKYRHATALTPNQKEFLDLAGIPHAGSEEEIREAALRLCRENGLDCLICTRSEKGISLIQRESGEKKDFPAEVKEVTDVTGAGDTVAAVLALALGAGFSFEEGVRLANVAASIVISRFGASQTTVEELSAAVQPYAKTAGDTQEVFAQLHRLREQGRQIVFTNGCFDLVHAGHISSFRQARSMGDILVVGVNSDASVRRLKGETRPIVGLRDRVALLSALETVDFVIPFEEDTPQALIERIRPDVLVKGRDWEGKEIAGGEFVRSYGGKVAFLELEQGLSTTGIIEKIRRAAEQEGVH